MTTPQASICRLVYVTLPDRQTARTIAHELVNARLIACANILGEVTSIYEWQETVHEDTEITMLMKTTEDRVEALIEQIKELHPYECPCIIAVPISHGTDDFLSWIKTQTRQSE